METTMMDLGYKELLKLHSESIPTRIREDTEEKIFL
jgi:hypothetical protein